MPLPPAPWTHQHRRDGWWVVAIEQRPVDLLGPFADEAAARELSAFPELKAAAWAVIDASGAARTIAANALSKAGLL